VNYQEWQATLKKIHKQVALEAITNPEKPYRVIADQFGIDRQMVGRICRKAGIIRPKGRKKDARS
jgi:hypothetical protein